MRKSYLLVIVCLLTIRLVTAQMIPEKSLNLITVKPQKLAEAPKKIFIKSFKIYYQMIAEAEEKVYGGRQLGGGSYTGNATARLAVGVEGVEPEDLQSLTDEIYQTYVAQLQALGLEVYTASNLPNIASFEDWERIDGPTINQEQIEGSLMVIPQDFSYFVKKITKSGKEKTGAFMSGVSGNDGSFMSSFYGPVPKLSDELDDMIVAEIALNIPSIYLDPKSRLGTARIKGGPYLRLGQAKASYISGKLGKPGVASPNAAIEMLLEKPVAINGVFKSEEFKAVASKSTTSVPSYASFFSVDNNTVELSNTIACDAAVYKTEVKKPIAEFLNLSLEKLETGLNGGKVK